MGKQKTPKKEPTTEKPNTDTSGFEKKLDESIKEKFRMVSDQRMRHPNSAKLI
jgi:hypothetical protein